MTRPAPKALLAALRKAALVELGLPGPGRERSRPTGSERSGAAQRVDRERNAGPNNRGRSTTGGPAVPYYPEGAVREAVKHLRLTCGRYLADRALLSDVDKAVALLAESRAQVLHTADTITDECIRQVAGYVRADVLVTALQGTLGSISRPMARGRCADAWNKRVKKGQP